MSRTGCPPAGVTLLETLMAVALIGVFAAMAVPMLTPDVNQQLESAAESVAADLAYARSLAVSRNSHYQFDFDKTADRYALTHSGDDTTLDILPSDPFRASGDAATQRVTDLASLPCLSCQLQLLDVRAGDAAVSVSDLEFGPLGSTTRTEETTIWLAAGGSARRRFVPVTVNPVTGLARVGLVRTSFPASSP